MTKTIATLSAIAVLVACGETTSSEELTCPSADVELCAAPPEVVTAAKGAAMDIGLRSVKGLQNTAVRTQLESRAAALASALQDGRVSRARDLIAEMRATIAEARPRGPAGDTPDLTAIELSLIVAARLLQ